MAVSVLPWVSALANRFFPSSFFPPSHPPTPSLSRKQRQKHAHPSARNRLAFPRYRKSSNKLPGQRSVTAAPPPGRQCAVTMCWKRAEKSMCIVALGEYQNTMLQAADGAATWNMTNFHNQFSIFSTVCRCRR